MMCFGCACLDGSSIDLIYSSWCIWLEIPWGRVHLSLQDLVGGQFWKNKPSLGFLGDWSPQVGCQGPTLRKMMTCLWRPRGHLGGSFPAPTCQMICLKGENRHLLGAWHHLRLSFGGDDGHLARFEGRDPWIVEERFGLKTIGLCRPSVPFSNSTT
jgi:hypothetical protein